MEGEPVIGLIAHIDTAPDFSGTGVRPKLHYHYDGGDILLGKSGRVLSPREFPDLESSLARPSSPPNGSTLLGGG